MYYYNLFTSLASKYPADSLWVLPPSNKRFRWMDFCIDSLRSGFDSGANPEGDDENREAYWRSAHYDLERIEYIMVSEHHQKAKNETNHHQ